MERQIATAVFSENSKTAFLQSERKFLGSRHRIFILHPNDIVLFQNSDTQAFFGVGRLGSFGDDKVYREHCLIDTLEIYSGGDMKYNKYDIKLDAFVIFPVEFSFVDLAELLDIDTGVRTNITKTSQLTFIRVFYKNDRDEQKIIKKIKLWLKSIVPQLLNQ